MPLNRLVRPWTQPEYRFSTCPPFRIVQTFPPYTYFPSGKQVVCGGVYGESLTDSWREETQPAADEREKKAGEREKANSSNTLRVVNSNPPTHNAFNQANRGKTVAVSRHQSLPPNSPILSDFTGLKWADKRSSRERERRKLKTSNQLNFKCSCKKKTVLYLQYGGWKTCVDFSFQGGGPYQNTPDLLLYCFVWFCQGYWRPIPNFLGLKGRGGGGWVSVARKPIPCR